MMLAEIVPSTVEFVREHEAWALGTVPATISNSATSNAPAWA